MSFNINSSLAADKPVTSKRQIGLKLRECGYYGRSNVFFLLGGGGELGGSAGSSCKEENH